MRDAERRGRIIGVRVPPRKMDEDEPWTAPPSRRRKEPPIAGPARARTRPRNEIYIAKDGPAPGLRNRLLRLAAFQNPEFYKAQSMRLPTYDKPRIIACAEDHPQIGLPRGCLEDVRQQLSDLKINPVVRDERCDGRPLDVRFAATSAASRGCGGCDAGPRDRRPGRDDGFWQNRHRGLAHRTTRCEHAGAGSSPATARTVDRRLSSFLGLRRNDRTDRRRTQKAERAVDVALIQSLVRKGVVDDRVGEYGHLIVDECHHLSAHSFEQVARRAKARFVAGCPRRSRARTAITRSSSCSAARCGIAWTREAQAATRPFKHRVFVRPTAFQPPRPPSPSKRPEFQALYEELVRTTRGIAASART